MDALILSCGTGGGHNAAGQAILEILQRRGHHAVMFNPYGMKGRRLAGRIDKAYLSVAKSAPHVFGAVYALGNEIRKWPGRSPVYHVNHALTNEMQEYLRNHPVDVVIMPHLFPAEIFTNMKCHGMEIPKTVFVATDYVCIPFTEETECDAYIVPSRELIRDFADRGIPREKIFPLGIPTRSSFAENLSKEEAKRRLMLALDKKYILVAGGSMGGGTIEKVIQRLMEELHRLPDTGLLVVCGSNEKLYHRFFQKQNERVRVIGFTKELWLYMKAADVFVTKPGGLSSTEAAVSRIPIVHAGAIPGCESYNEEYFTGHGMSVTFSSGEDLVQTMEKLLYDEAAYHHMMEMQKRYVNPNAAEDICVFLEEMLSQNGKM